jgi:hypothetical protein
MRRRHHAQDHVGTGRARGHTPLRRDTLQGEVVSRPYTSSLGRLPVVAESWTDLRSLPKNY